MYTCLKLKEGGVEVGLMSVLQIGMAVKTSVPRGLDYNSLNDVHTCCINVHTFIKYSHLLCHLFNLNNVMFQRVSFILIYIYEVIYH